MLVDPWGGGSYHVPPALSLLSKTWIFLKQFSALNAAAVIAPSSDQCGLKIGRGRLPAAPAPIMATDLIWVSSDMVQSDFLFSS
jgi:hypothetical protein